MDEVIWLMPTPSVCPFVVMPDVTFYFFSIQLLCLIIEMFIILYLQDINYPHERRFFNGMFLGVL